MWHVGDVSTRPWWGNLKEGDQLEDFGLGSEDNIKVDLKKVEWIGVDWTYLPHHKDKWRALVNTATNLRVDQLRNCQFLPTVQYRQNNFVLFVF
jgi:hypothetical protein